MNQGELYGVIDATAAKTAEQVVKEFKKQNLLVTGKQSPFQKVETLLFNYRNFCKVVSDREREIEEILSCGLPKKSTGIGSFMTSDGFVESKSEMEKVEERVEQLRESIRVTRNYIKIIDDAVEELKDDPYYGLISMRYFDGMTRDEIADYYGVDPKTVTRNKNRLVNLLQIRLFSDQVITDLFTC